MRATRFARALASSPTLLLLLLSLLLLGTIAASARTPVAPRACALPERHQFDFFLGDWDTYDVDVPDKVVARNRVTAMVDGCGVREVYEQADGLRGESISAYDGVRRGWHQTWVTNRGTLLLLDGRLDGGRMVLTGTERTSGRDTALLRGTWWREGGAVRERADRSPDGGATWAPAFDIVVRPHRDARDR